MKTKEESTKTSRFTGLESLRGLAALLIVCFHVRFLPPLEVPGWLDHVVSTFGASVPLFYGISAFSLFVGYEHALERSEGLRKFYIRRFFRIAPLFYSMLVVHLLLRKFCFHAVTNPREVLMNVAFVFGLLPGQHEGLVWASWSIGVEWIFYALFPLFLLTGRTLCSAALLFTFGLLVSLNTGKLLEGIAKTVPSFAYMCFLNHLAFFSAGVLAYRLASAWTNFHATAPGKTRRFLPWVLAASSFVWLWLGWFGPLSAPLFRWDWATHWPAGAWIVLLMGTMTGLPWMLDNPFLRCAGRLSFGLYLIHAPLVYFVSRLGFFGWVYHRVGSTGWAFVLCCFTSVFVAMLAAQAAFVLIENPGIRLGERVWRALKERVNDEFAPKPPGSIGATLPGSPVER